MNRYSCTLLIETDADPAVVERELAAAVGGMMGRPSLPLRVVASPLMPEADAH